MRTGYAVAAVCAAGMFATSVHAGDTAGNIVGTLFGRTSASVTYGPYLRFEAGPSATDLSDANWLPPGGSDPRVFFDFADQDSAFVGAAVGFDWMNGFRADVGLVSAGEVDATGPWSYAVPADPGPHASITDARVRTTALMGNVFYSPLEQRGVNSRVQPYVVAGLGFARNEMSDWTRSNPASSNPVRSFAGDSSIDLAWSLGAGVSVQVTRPGQHPVLLDLSLRYYDFGTAEGGTTPIGGAGSSVPREGLQVDRSDTVVTIGVRVPLKRY
ncbi:outer membrane protein [Defluviimonas sp. SAOS-178_SWC]|uniref:outer membrane protein n=1 Tax=Defluviimonas sp. SAOS-178_SWC TaxID=3121287 RepID=UPI0032218421